MADDDTPDPSSDSFTPKVNDLADSISCVVSAGLLPFLVPLDSLHEDPDNANGHDETSLAAISESYTAFGQQKPIVVNALGKVVAGNGQYEVARRMGWTHIAAVVGDFDGDELKELAFAIADNKTAQFAEWNFPNLAESLRSLESTEWAAATGFDADEIKKIAEGFSPDKAADEDNDTSPQMGELEFRIVIDCHSEEHQRQLLEKLENEGLSCRPLMS